MVVSRKVARNLKSMHAMLQQHQYEGRNPPLQAINTLYLSLLEGNADSTAWAKFTKLASLPLVTTKFTPKCVVDEGYYGMKGKWHTGPCPKSPHCGHANVEQSCLVHLTALDQHRLDFTAANPNAQQWWGKQLAQALGGVVS